MTAPTVVLSDECRMAGDRGVEELHAYCRKAHDVPLPHGMGVLLARASCRCLCHSVVAR
jgi:hypothetical protein